MKTLYVGVYRDGTGWGQAALDYILSLDADGIEVVPRALKLNDRQVPLPKRILELEKRSSRGCVAAIQHVLPHQMSYSGHFERNVGLFASETNHFRNSGWPQRLNTMDEVWAINPFQSEACKRSGVAKPVKVAPHATDITRFQRSYSTLEALKPLKESGSFLFYFVGEMVRRKNLAALLRAFHTEFSPSEPVSLVIKTDVPGESPSGSFQRVSEFCAEIRRGLKLHGRRDDFYKEEVVLTERLTEEGMMRLHATCDCFVMPSYGEAWSIPCFDSMAMGRTPIVTAQTGMEAYVSEKSGWVVESREEPVFGITDTFDDIFVANETWQSIDILKLRIAMRTAFEDRKTKEEKARNGIERAYEFSYERIGALLSGFLNDPQRDPTNLAAVT